MNRYTLILLAIVCALAQPHRVIAQNSPVTTGTSVVDAAEQQDWTFVAQHLTNPNPDKKNDVNASQPDGMTALHWAVFHQSTDAAKKLLTLGANPNAATKYEIVPLSIAAQSGNLELVNLLLEHSANPNAKLKTHETVLMTAARTGNAEIVRKLIAHDADVNLAERKGQTAIMWTAAEGHTEVVDVLIEAGADFKATLKSGFSPLMFAARNGRTDVVMRLLDAGVEINTVMKPANPNGRNARKNTSALLLAVENGHFELALMLIERGADPNDQRSGFAPLHALTWVRKTKVGDGVDGDPPPRGSGSVNSLEFARRMIAAGADPNLKLKQGSPGRSKLNPKGATPFLLACRTADVELVELMLELGADPQMKNSEGCTTAMAAAGVGVLAVGEEPGSVAEVAAVLKILVAAGVDINAVDDNGETAMHGAAYRNYPETVKLLAELGADPKNWNQKNKWKATPTMIASGKRPGSLKPSPETIAALKLAISKQGGTQTGKQSAKPDSQQNSK